MKNLAKYLLFVVIPVLLWLSTYPYKESYQLHNVFNISWEHMHVMDSFDSGGNIQNRVEKLEISANKTLTRSNVRLHLEQRKVQIEQQLKLGPQEKLDLFISQNKYQQQRQNLMKQQGKKQQIKGEEALIKQQQRVYIWTLTRSGSSFLGHLFEKHDDVFYMFEPFQKVDWLTDNGSSDKRTSFLIDLLNCSISSDNQEIFTKLRTSHTGNHDSTTKSACSINPYKCYKKKKKQIKLNIQKINGKVVCVPCGNEKDRQIFQNSCEQKTKIVVKEILIRISGGMRRFYDLSKPFWSTKFISTLR